MTGKHSDRPTTMLTREDSHAIASLLAHHKTNPRQLATGQPKHRQRCNQQRMRCSTSCIAHRLLRTVRAPYQVLCPTRPPLGLLALARRSRNPTLRHTQVALTHRFGTDRPYRSVCATHPHLHPLPLRSTAGRCKQLILVNRQRLVLHSKYHLPQAQ